MGIKRRKSSGSFFLFSGMKVGEEGKNGSFWFLVLRVVQKRKEGRGSSCFRFRSRGEQS